MKFLTAALLFAFLSFYEVGYCATAQKTDNSSGLQQTLDQFLTAFSNLEWDSFRSFFAEDATAFFPPSAHVPHRIEGKANIEAIFKTLFENARKGNKSGPPFIKIEPQDLKIQTFENVGLVTFHLQDPGVFGRRTIVFHKQNGKWLIVHLHASGIFGKAQ